MEVIEVIVRTAKFKGSDMKICENVSGFHIFQYKIIENTLIVFILLHIIYLFIF